MRLTLGLLLWLAATAPAAQSETIVVEAEEFSNLAGWRPVSGFYREDSYDCAKDPGKNNFGVSSARTLASWKSVVAGTCLRLRLS